MNPEEALLARQEIVLELSGGERLLWSGRPRQGILFRSSDITQIPFALFWTGFALYWESLMAPSGQLFMILWGVPFIVVGLHILIGRFVWDRWVRSKTYYGLTDHRAQRLARIS
jgi:hypothetical protein